MTEETYEAELLIAFFASVFIDKVSYASAFRGKLQGGEEELSAADDNPVSDYLQELIPTWDHGTRQTISTDMREMAHALARLLSHFKNHASYCINVIIWDPQMTEGKYCTHLQKRLKEQLEALWANQSHLSLRKTGTKSSRNKFLGTGIRIKWLWQSACCHQWVHYSVNYVWFILLPSVTLRSTCLDN